MLGCAASRYRARKSLGCSEREAFMEPGSLSPDVFLGREVWVGAGRVACPVPSGENLRGWRCRSFPGDPGIVWVGEELIESNCYPFWDVISSVESSSPPAREDSELSKLPS